MPAAWTLEKEIEMHVGPGALGRRGERRLTRRAGWIALTLAAAVLLLGSVLVFRHPTTRTYSPELASAAED
jgi:hypothetical protein